MKYFYLLAFGIISFVHFGCSKCKDTHATVDMPNYTFTYYFPYSPDDTVSFVHNSSDTIHFIASTFTKTYDNFDWSPLDGTAECRDYFTTQNVKQSLTSSMDGTIQLASFITWGTINASHEPSDWDYQVQFKHKFFQDVYLEHIGRWGDSITFSNHTYQYVEYMVTNYDKDTVYLTKQGIIRMVLSNDIYDRILK